MSAWLERTTSFARESTVDDEGHFRRLQQASSIGQEIMKRGKVYAWKGRAVRFERSVANVQPAIVVDDGPLTRGESLSRKRFLNGGRNINSSGLAKRRRKTEKKTMKKKEMIKKMMKKKLKAV